MRPSWRAFAASLAASVLTLLAFPPFDMWLLAFAAPAPLLWAAERAGERRWGAAVGAFLGALPLWAWEEQWIFGVSAPGAVLLVIHLSMYAGAIVGLTGWLAARVGLSVWVLGPVVWVGLEVLRGRVMWEGYPWLLAGHPLIAEPKLAHAASVVGAYGVSLLTVWASAAAWVAIVKRGRERVAGAAALGGVAAVWALLSSAPRVEAEGSVRVAVVQTNVPQSVKGGWSGPERVRDLDHMLGLTIRACAADPRPELVVWPETMFPGAGLDAVSLAEERAARLVWFTKAEVVWPRFAYIVWRGIDGEGEPEPVQGPFSRGDTLAIPTTVAPDSVLAWQARLGVPLLLGAEGVEGLEIDFAEDGSVREEARARYNSTYLIAGGRVLPERYDKMHLTPFGEVMPYISSWKWLETIFLRVGIGASGMSFDLDAGERPVVHTLDAGAGPVRIATPVCFEAIMPGVCRGLAYEGGERRADLFVQLTNEGWFGGFDAGREQHLQIVRWRAVELGISVVRAANTGISAVVDPEGRIVASGVEGGVSNVDGVLSAGAPLARGATLYGRLGDATGWLSLGATGCLVGVAALRGRLQSRRGRKSDVEAGGEGQPQ